MSPSSALTGACGAGVAAGAAALVGLARRSSRARWVPGAVPSPERPGARAPFGDRSAKVLLVLATGSIVALVTGWPVAGILGGVAAFALPPVLRTPSLGASSARAEAVAGWTELIRDAMSASAGLAQAIVVTSRAAPPAIRPAVQLLATRLASGVAMEAALREFAADVEDPAADLVVCALLLATTAQAQKLTDVLGALASSTREDVAMRQRVDASRAGVRSGVRTIVLFSVSFVVLLLIFASSYLAPYGSVTGQMMLALVGMCYVGGLGLMLRLVRPRPALRLLGSDPGR